MVGPEAVSGLGGTGGGDESRDLAGRLLPAETGKQEPRTCGVDSQPGQDVPAMQSHRIAPTSLPHPNPEEVLSSFDPAQNDPVHGNPCETFFAAPSVFACSGGCDQAPQMRGSRDKFIFS